MCWDKTPAHGPGTKKDVSRIKRVSLKQSSNAGKYIGSQERHCPSWWGAEKIDSQEYVAIIHAEFLTF